MTVPGPRHARATPARSRRAFLARLAALAAAALAGPRALGAATAGRKIVRPAPGPRFEEDRKGALKQLAELRKATLPPEVGPGFVLDVRRLPAHGQKE